MYCNKENIAILTDLLCRHGVCHVVVCPGSRNAPLVHNFHAHPDIICHAATDERSAGFMALGIGIATRQPAAVCVTSGSALLNVLPAAAEATYQRQGILVISADRPAAWTDQLDGQTLPQPGALGCFAPKCVTLPEPHTDEERWHCNRLVNEALLNLTDSCRPSVHINVPISEPLFDFSLPELPQQRVVRWMKADRAVAHLREAERPMVVIGQLPRPVTLPEGITVLAEQLSTDEATVTDQVIAALPADASPYLPDCVLYLGGHTVSKRLRLFLRALPASTTVIMAQPEGALQDVTQQAVFVVKAQPEEMLTKLQDAAFSPNAFSLRWAQHIAAILKREADLIPDELHHLAVKCLEGNCIGTDDMVFYANSTSVRLGVRHARHFIHCNRGLNGIEGSLSVAAGAALANPAKRVWCIIGDLSFFYDANALWSSELSGNLRILLLNNQTGGIFYQLPGLDQSPARDTFIAASHSLTAEHLCQHFDIGYLQATDEASLGKMLPLLRDVKSSRPVLLEVALSPSEAPPPSPPQGRTLFGNALPNPQTTKRPNDQTTKRPND